MCVCTCVRVHVCVCVCVSHGELQQRGHAGEQLQDEGLPVEDVELPAAELHTLSQQRVALIVSVGLQKQQPTVSRHL